jgi:hypothetical protein
MQSESTLKSIPPVFKEIEKDTLKIMQQTDQIPYFNRAIAEKKAIEQKNKKMEDKKTSKKSEEKSQSSPEEPKPMMFRENILKDLLEKEKQGSENNKKEAKPPKDISETWEKINTTILQLHSKWNVLEPLLIQQSTSTEMIAAFKDTLDNLTKYGINKDQFGTLVTANNLTAYLPKFMIYFKKQVPPEIYSLKYHVRNIVLNAAADNYPAAEESLRQIKQQGEMLKTTLIEKKAMSVINQFDTSTTNLQKSLQKKDIDLIKINAGIVMKNIMRITDVFYSSIKS